MAVQDTVYSFAFPQPADWTFLFGVIAAVWIPNLVLVLLSLWLAWIFKTNQFAVLWVDFYGMQTTVQFP